MSAERDLLEQLKNRPVRKDLGPVKDALDQFEIPTQTKIVQVVGSNGKGSVVHYLSNLFQRFDKRVVSYTSPHFNHPAERFRINDSNVSRERSIGHLQSVTDRTNRELSPFETLFLVAVEMAEEEEPDFLVLEAGMGGRWDATSAIPADLTILTSVEVEHSDYLGDNPVEISREKTAQIPPGSTLVIPPLSDDVQAVVDDRAKEKQLDVIRIDGEETVHGTLKSLAGAGASHLTDPSPSHLREHLQDVSPPPGRLEFREIDRRKFLFDVAHTPGAVDNLVDVVQEKNPSGDMYVLFGCLENKEAEKMTEALSVLVPGNRLWPVLPSSERAIGRDELRSLDYVQGPVRSVEQAREEVMDRSNPGDLVVVTGSFSLVGSFRSHLDDPR